MGQPQATATKVDRLPPILVGIDGTVRELGCVGLGRTGPRTPLDGRRASAARHVPGLSARHAGGTAAQPCRTWPGSRCSTRGCIDGYA